MNEFKLNFNKICSVCQITIEKNSSNQLCDTCKLLHSGDYIIVKVIGHTQIPIHNKYKIDFYNDFETADLDRIYYQTDHNELLKVIKL